MWIVVWASACGCVVSSCECNSVWVCECEWLCGSMRVCEGIGVCAVSVTVCGCVSVTGFVGRRLCEGIGVGLSLCVSVWVCECG